MRIKKFINQILEENSYLVIDKESCFVVDPGILCESLVSEATNYKVEFVLLTHSHIDHVDGLRYFTAPIYILDKGVNNLFDYNVNLYQMLDSKIPYLDKKELVKPLFDNQEIDFNGHKIKVISTEGHTNCSACFLLDNKYLFTGDTLFKESIGRTDLPTGNQREMDKSLKKLIGLANEIIIYPGHDGSSTISEEKKFNPFLRRLL